MLNMQNNVTIVKYNELDGLSTDWRGEEIIMSSGEGKERLSSHITCLQLYKRFGTN